MPYKIITIAQQKGGAGKTTIAAHLAVALSQSGKKIAAIDTDPQGSFTKWHDIRKEKFGENGTGIEFKAVSGWRLHNEIESVKDKADVIIVDSPPHMQTETKTAIRTADLVIIPAQPSPTDLWATDATIQLVTEERIPHRVLLNRVVHNSNLSRDMSGKFSSVMETRLGNRTSFAASLATGEGVTEAFHFSPAALEIKSLLMEVSSLLFPFGNELEMVA